MITACRSCRSRKLVDVFDLGRQHLSDFRDDNEKPPLMPLRALFCEDCLLVQLDHTARREDMYHDRYGFKSGVNDTIRADLADIAWDALRRKPDARTWLDIASNDGTLLSNVPTNIWRVGVDPVAKLCAEARQHADRVVTDFFHPQHFTHGDPFDVVTSVSVFYDLDDPNDFVAGVKQVLADGGVWVIQQNYLLQTLALNAIDNFCHEHITYFSLLSLESLLDRHGLQVFDVSLSGVNGGSFRTLVCRKGERPVAAAVATLRNFELAFGVYNVATYESFGLRASALVARTGRLVRYLNRQGKRVYIYGASTRGATIWQAAGLDVNDLPFAVDRNPAKVGKRIASIGVPIISEEQARAERPDYMLVSPWFFRDEFVAREADYLAAGGHLIFPLPNLEIV